MANDMNKLELAHTITVLRRELLVAESEVRRLRAENELHRQFLHARRHMHRKVFNVGNHPTLGSIA